MKQAEVLIGGFAIAAGALIVYELGKSSPIDLHIGNQRVDTSADGVNNPGNIRNSSTIYEGEITQPGAVFKSFDSMAYGFRAMVEILINHYHDGDDTIRKEIERYAPSSENDTDTYVQYVADFIQVDPDVEMGFVFNSNLLDGMLAAMTSMEQGNNFVFNEADIQRGISIA